MSDESGYLCGYRGLDGKMYVLKAVPLDQQDPPIPDTPENYVVRELVKKYMRNASEPSVPSPVNVNPDSGTSGTER